MAKAQWMKGGRRVAIVRGLRTPFEKAGTVFSQLSALDLGRIVVQELLQRSELDPVEIDQVGFGQVIPGLTATSIAREVELGALHQLLNDDPAKVERAELGEHRSSFLERRAQPPD